MSDRTRYLERQTHSLCEADSFSCSCLWERWAQEAAKPKYPTRGDPYRVPWVHISEGTTKTLGEVAGRVVTLTLFWARISGKIVCFWSCDSMLADYAMVREYLHTQFPGRYRTDAMNFGNLILQLDTEIVPVPAPKGVLMRWSRIGAKRPWTLSA